MKKGKWILLAAVMILGIAGAVTLAYRKESQQALWSVDWEDSYVCQLGSYSCTSNGILYASDLYLRYCDNVGGKDALICTDQNCRHAADTDSSCGAYVSASWLGGAAVRGSHILYLAGSRQEYGDCALYAADLDGKQRKKLADFSGMGIVFDVLYHQNMVYISYMDIAQEQENDGERYGIYAYDLEKKTGKDIFSQQGNGFTANGMAMGDDVLYFSYVYTDASRKDILTHKKDEKYAQNANRQRVVGIRPETGETVVTLEGYGNNCILLYAQGNVFYTKPETLELYMCAEAEGKEKKISSEKDLIPVLGQSDGKVFFRSYDEDTGKLTYLQYDIAKDAWSTIGQTTSQIDCVSGEYAYGIVGQEKGRIDVASFLQGKTLTPKPYEIESEEGL